jgi:hypothetical protein
VLALLVGLAVSNLPVARSQWVSEVLPVELQIGYAVRAIDMNGDRKLDILITDSKRYLWLENPTWQTHVIHATPDAKNDNVCMAPLDIDGDGKLDLAIGHDWQPNNTQTGGEVGWLKSPADPSQPWTYTKIGEEPTTHRMHWSDLDQDGKSELIVLPLKGRNSVAPAFDQTAVRILQFSIPSNPSSDPWPMKVLNEDLHVAHNFEIADMYDEGTQDLLVASYEGATRIKFTKDLRSFVYPQGMGHQGVAPALGSSEIRLGHLAGGSNFLATIEPWHGDQVVVYSHDPKRGLRFMLRDVIDRELKWGHAVACADLDFDSDDEIVVGLRDDAEAPHRCGIRIYDFANDKWERKLIEPGQVAVEDMVVADLDGDGRRDIIAVGRATHNAVLYWNRN